MKTLGKKTLGLLRTTTSTALFLIVFVFAAAAADYPAPQEGDFVARDLPPLLARDGIERRHKRFSLVIAVDDQRVAIERGRTAFAVPVQRLHAS